MKILSYHPFSLFATGGGSRILRRLYQNNEYKITSLVLDTNTILPEKSDIHEYAVSLIPLHRPWMRWKLRTFATWLREVLFKNFSARRILKKARNLSFDVLHVVDHGSFSAILCEQQFLLGKLLWVSFHDHFSTTSSTFANTKKLWNIADRRLVISAELGQEYNRLFGDKSFEIITDGVLFDEISKPVLPQKDIVTVYFAGLLHIDYLPLFKVLADALDILHGEGLKIKLILRGTQYVNFLDNRKFEVEYRPFLTEQAELKKELDSATILYLPIKFTIPDFYLYSLSTKMVGYLGGAGSILYHGPADSAASNLLNQSESAIGCYTLNTKDMIDGLHRLLDENCKVSFNAKVLAVKSFDFEKIRERFWNTSST